jgi:pimeloyl-ACP methyl ester carboxylesterase
MPRVQANGLSLHVQALGAGPPVVMLHGLLVGSLATWYFTVAPALARDCEVLLYDLRGHGLSTRTPSGYDLGTMVDDLDALLDGMRVTRGQPVTLVGHSYGGLVALAYALRRPERVARLGLVEIPLPPSKLDALAAVAARELAVGIGDFVEREPDAVLALLPEALRRTAGTATRRRGRRIVDGVGELLTRTTLLEDLRREPDLDDARIAALRCPVLSVYGDGSMCLDAAARLERALPRAVHRRLTGGHMLPLDARLPLTDLLASFVHG